MHFVGIDSTSRRKRQVLQRKRFYANRLEDLDKSFASLGWFRAVVEATASYEWLVQRLEPLANHVLLGHPK